ncbi:flagellar biosynthetic protein FliR [Vibrio chagasii]|nr:flagellar biosynthetic protein FliR [Vibrio chagasii]
MMLLSNITFGLMNKAAPSLNVFALGFLNDHATWLIRINGVSNRYRRSLF